MERHTCDCCYFYTYFWYRVGFKILCIGCLKEAAKIYLLGDENA